MTTKEAVPKSTQSKRNPLTSACPTASATTPLLLVIYRFFIGVFVGADYPIATSLITEFTPPQAPPRDIDGHGLGGVVFGRYRGRSRRLRFVRRRRRMEAHARLHHRTLRLPADRQVQSPRIAPVAEEQGTPRGGAPRGVSRVRRRCHPRGRGRGAQAQGRLCGGVLEGIRRTHRIIGDPHVVPWACWR